MQKGDSRRRFVKRLGAIALVGSLAGCGGDGDDDDTDTEMGGNGNGNGGMTDTETDMNMTATDTETGMNMTATPTETDMNMTDTPTEEPGTPTATPTPTPVPGRDEFLSGVPNYDGNSVDNTGQSSVTVAVGADGLLFTPPAITISTGTTVTWEWEGPNHNVVARDPETTFNSGDPQSSGTYEYTFENAGEYPYLCEPHSFQMKGYVTVVE